MNIVIISYHNNKKFNLMSAPDIISAIDGIKKDYDFEAIIILGNTPQNLSNIQNGNDLKRYGSRIDIAKYID